MRPPETDEEFRQAIEKITSIPEFKDIDFEFVTLSTKDSTNLCPEDWEEFIAYVNYRQKDFDFIVCPHGTDTMTYTASAFSFGFSHPETNGSALFLPVIFTGSQKPIAELGGDGEKNIISAIQTGIEADKANITDVLIAFDNVVVQAVKACKTSDHRYDAFDSVDGVHVGTISALGANLHNAHLAITSSALHRQQMAASYNPDQAPPNGKFAININDKHHKANGYIADITLHPGVTEHVLKPHIVDKNCMGIVMTSLGAGNIPENMIPVIEEATSKYNLPIFSVSPFIGGAVHADMYEAAELAYEAGASFPGDQSSSCIWVKAHWLIANGMGMTSRDLILNMQRIFRGEGSISDSAEIVPEAHNKKPTSPRNGYRKRVLRNYTAMERYRQEKGSDLKLISLPSHSKNPVLPQADLRILKL